MTGKQWGIAGLIIIILGGVAYFVFKHDTTAPAATGPMAYEWQFTDKSGAEQTKTQVTLVAGGKSHVVGTYDGTCAEQTTDYLPNEKAKVVCWFAGGGNEVGVFEQDGKTTVQVGDVDEGSQETPGFRGNFKVVETL